MFVSLIVKRASLKDRNPLKKLFIKKTLLAGGIVKFQDFSCFEISLTKCRISLFDWLLCICLQWKL